MVTPTAWEQDIFFDTSKMTLEEKKNLMRDAFAVCDSWMTDILDCSVSWARQRIDMSFDEALDLLNNACHFVVINRKGYPERFCGEFSFSTIRPNDADYFLFIYTSEEALTQLVNKYKLEKVE